MKRSACSLVLLFAFFISFPRAYGATTDAESIDAPSKRVKEEAAKVEPVVRPLTWRFDLGLWGTPVGRVLSGPEKEWLKYWLVRGNEWVIAPASFFRRKVYRSAEQDLLNWRRVERKLRWLREELEFTRRPDEVCREIAWLFASVIGNVKDGSGDFCLHSWALTVNETLGDARPGRFAEPPVGVSVWGRAAKERLQKRLGLDVRIMAEVEKKYGGDMDWRLAAPHVLYWLTRSARFSPRSKERPTPLELYEKYKTIEGDPDWMIFESLKKLCERGRLAYMDESQEGEISLTWSLRRAEDAHARYVARIAQLEADERRLEEALKAGELGQITRLPEDFVAVAEMRESHIGLLGNFTQAFYFAELETRALKFFRYGQEKYGAFCAYDKRPYTLEEYHLGTIKKLLEESRADRDPTRPYTLEEYCLGPLKKILEESGTRPNVRAMVERMLIRHYYIYACHCDLEAKAWKNKARLWWKYYVKDSILRDQGMLRPRRSKLPTFDALCAKVLRRIGEGDVRFPQPLKDELRKRLDLPKPWGWPSRKSNDREP